MIISAEGDVSVHHCFEAMLISLQEDYRQNTLDGCQEMISKRG